MLRDRKTQQQGEYELVMLEELVPQDHFLRKVDAAVDFSFIHDMCKDLYCLDNGRPAIEPELLNKKGCLFLTRPSVFPHNAVPEAFRENAADLFAAIDSGMVTASIGGRFPLDQIATVHQVAESRATQGATLIIP